MEYKFFVNFPGLLIEDDPASQQIQNYNQHVKSELQAALEDMDVQYFETQDGSYIIKAKDFYKALDLKKAISKFLTKNEEFYHGKIKTNEVWKAYCSTVRIAQSAPQRTNAQEPPKFGTIQQSSQNKIREPPRFMRNVSNVEHNIQQNLNAEASCSHQPNETITLPKKRRGEPTAVTPNEQQRNVFKMERKIQQNLKVEPNTEASCSQQPNEALMLPKKRRGEQLAVTPTELTEQNRYDCVLKITHKAELMCLTRLIHTVSITFVGAGKYERYLSTIEGVMIHKIEFIDPEFALLFKAKINQAQLYEGTNSTYDDLTIIHLSEDEEQFYEQLKMIYDNLNTN